MNKTAAVSLAVLALAGCIHVKTENEIKPIKITMDVNLKIDKRLDEVFADENGRKPSGLFKEVKEMLDRQAAGITSDAMLVARDGATDDDKILIYEENQRRMRRFNQIAAESGVSVETVQKRRAMQWQSKIPEGSGVWYQTSSGEWRQK